MRVLTGDWGKPCTDHITARGTKMGVVFIDRGAGKRLNLLRCEDRRGIGVVDHRKRDIGEALLSVARVGSKQHERSVHIDGTALGEYALSLLDDHPAIQGTLELLADQMRVGQGPLMQYPDGGNVGEGLADGNIGGGHVTDLGPE